MTGAACWAQAAAAVAAAASPPCLQAAAFQELLGLSALPQNGRQAQQASRQLADQVLACLGPPPPLLSQLLAERLSAFPPPRPRFADVSTGLRLRYLEWGSGGDVVLLLHDLGESADIWLPLAARLADRGYRVLAPDMRGEHRPTVPLLQTVLVGDRLYLGGEVSSAAHPTAGH